MMATTHVFGALSLAAVVAVVAPEFALVVAVAAIAGGFFPDLDLYAGHRKTLHFPVYYVVAAAASGVVAVVAPTTTTVALAAFFLASAVHSTMDVFGGGLEVRPWLGTSDRAVYSHYHGRWLRPRRWVRYDGAPEDLALAGVLALPALVVFDGFVRDLVLVLLAISLVYTIVRKPIVRATERLLDRLPESVVDRIPARFLPIEERAVEGRTTSD